MLGAEKLEQMRLVLEKMEARQVSTYRLLREWFDYEKVYIEEVRARTVKIDKGDARREARARKDSELYRERTEEVRENEKRLSGRNSAVAELDAVMFLRAQGYSVKKKENGPDEQA